MRGLLAIVLVFLASPAVLAQQSMPVAPLANQQLDNAQAEKSASELMETIRCLTCQGQSIADSDAPMASDMRHHIRARIAAGESPQAVREWLIERYGDYISYEPRLSVSTAPLFVVPLIILFVIGVVLWRRLGKTA